jgi:hypothetical protein
MAAYIGLDEAQQRHNQSVAFNRVRIMEEINELGKKKKGLDLYDRGECF